MPPLHRILDANANRAREALRLLEEYARFCLNDAALAESAKSLRHGLAASLARLPQGLLAANRDTPGDVGTAISTAEELTRPDVRSVVIAAGKRLSEALRCLEEYGKVLDVDFARAAQTLRYRGYELESRLAARLDGSRGRQWRLCILLTESLCRKPWREVLTAVLEAGADCIQLREKSLGDSELLDRAAHIVEACRSFGASSIINDRPDLALLAGADGVHVGQTDLAPADIRRLAGDQLLIGVSTSCIEEARAARDAGAAYCGLGPMFPSATKAKPRLAGVAYLREFLEEITLPHLAISGITPENIAALVEAGVRGVAVSSAVCAAENPGAIVRSLLNRLDGA